MGLNDMLAKLGGQSGVLPEMVSQATPQGSMPSDDPFSKGVAALRHLTGR